MADYRKCNEREIACVWHRRCHCRHGISPGGNYRGTENMPFCIKLVQAGKCPKNFTQLAEGVKA